MPEALPDGETILWQGSPEWRSLAARAFHIRLLGAYFVMLVGWRVASAWLSGSGWASVGESAAWMALLPIAGVGIVSLLAWTYHRTTIYTITNQRVVMHFGVALPISLNLPFGIVETAAAKVHRDGTADIPLALNGDGRMSYLHLWPHARPWKLRNPQPMLRSIPDGAHVAALLANALEASQTPPRPTARMRIRVQETDNEDQTAPFAPAAA
jgi:hypothetical protein